MELTIEEAYWKITESDRQHEIKLMRGKFIEEEYKKLQKAVFKKDEEIASLQAQLLDKKDQTAGKPGKRVGWILPGTERLYGCI